MKTTLISLAIATILTGPLPALAAGKVQMTLPDFTKGEAIPAGATHDWNLGTTGARGCMFCDKMVATDARQIAITKVEKGPPANGVLAVSAVLLGAGGKPFPGTEGHKTLGNWYTTLLHAHGNPIEHYGDLDLDMARQKLGPTSAIKQFLA